MTTPDPVKPRFKVKIKGSNRFLCQSGVPLGVTATWSTGGTPQLFVDAWSWTDADGNSRYIALDRSTGNQRKLYLTAGTQDSSLASTLDANDRLAYQLTQTQVAYVADNDVYGQVVLTTDVTKAVAIETVMEVE